MRIWPSRKRLGNAELGIGMGQVPWPYAWGKIRPCRGCFHMCSLPPGCVFSIRQTPRSRQTSVDRGVAWLAGLAGSAGSVPTGRSVSGVDRNRPDVGLEETR